MLEYNKRFLKNATPEEIAECEGSFQLSINRTEKMMDECDVLSEPHEQELREIVVGLIAVFRTKAAAYARQVRRVKCVAEKGLQDMANLAIKNADAMEYWRRLALAYEEKLKGK